MKSVNLEQIGKIIALQMLSIKNFTNEIARWIKIQEDIGLDVLVHGEFERNDMVEFLGKTSRFPSNKIRLGTVLRFSCS